MGRIVARRVVEDVDGAFEGSIGNGRGNRLTHKAAAGLASHTHQDAVFDVYVGNNAALLYLVSQHAQGDGHAISRIGFHIAVLDVEVTDGPFTEWNKPPWP